MEQAVRIFEVGLRDGLQNEAIPLDLSSRLHLAEQLVLAGVRCLELGAFVSPEWVPQMANSGKLIERFLQDQNEGRIAGEAMVSALVPNMRGFEDAVKTGIKEIAVFAAASESFSQKNTNCSISESVQRFEPVFKASQEHGVRVRGYVSTVFGCPYEGKVDVSRVKNMAQALLDLGVYEVSLGDTIGAATPAQTIKVLEEILKDIDAEKLALHFHDTRGMALANILRALDCGIRSFDGSIGGLGGCPYAVGASGNVATEEVVYLLESLGFDTGIDVGRLIQLTPWIAERVQHSLPSRLSRAGLLK